jgi:hypothetical protein
MLNEGDYLARHFHHFFPLLLALWLLPWIGLAVWLDQGRRQFTLAAVMWATALACVEMGAGFWLGFGVIVVGIFNTGILVFVPTLIAHKRILRRKRKLQALPVSQVTAAGD